MTLYSLRTFAGLDFRITKFDSDLNAESSYLVNDSYCECPQGHKPTCRHRRMLPLMLDRVDTAWFYDFDKGLWQDPTSQAHVEMFAPVPDEPSSEAVGSHTEVTLPTEPPPSIPSLSPKPWRRL